MRLIKLTVVKQIPTHNERRQETNTHNFFKERYFNADKIECFTQINGATYVCMSTAAYGVMETPEEIIQLIKQSKEIFYGYKIISNRLFNYDSMRYFS